MNAPALGRDVAPLGREVGCHGLCPWGSTQSFDRNFLKSKKSRFENKEDNQPSLFISFIFLPLKHKSPPPVFLTENPLWFIPLSIAPPV